MSQELATKELLLYSMFIEKMKLIGFGRSITIIWSHWNTALWPNEVIDAFYAILELSAAFAFLAFFPDYVKKP